MSILSNKIIETIVRVIEWKKFFDGGVFERQNHIIICKISNNNPKFSF